MFADYCANTVWALEVTDGLGAGRRVTLTTEIDHPTAVVDDERGTVYVLSASGPLYRLDA